MSDSYTERFGLQIEEARQRLNRIVRFEYMKKNEKESGPALVGIELETVEDYNRLVNRMIEYGLDFTVLEPHSDLGRYIV